MSRPNLRLFVLLFLALLLPACRQATPTPTAAPNAAQPLNPDELAWPPTPASVIPRPVVVAEPAVSLVVQWNDVMLAAIRHGKPRPTVITRSLFMVHSAMYDAWSLYDPVAIPTVLDPTLRRPDYERTYVNKAAAVSQAAYQMLIALFPDYEAQSHAFSTFLQNLGYQPTSTGTALTPAGIGYLAAQAILTSRADDGANAANNYADVVSATYPELYVPANKIGRAACRERV